MKTSDRLFLLAVVVLLASLCSYNFALKVEYDRQDFKSEFYGYSKLNYKDFNGIDIKGANLLNVKIVRADYFDVRARKRPNRIFRITQSGKMLKIAFLPDNEIKYTDEKEIVILCPKLNNLNLDGEKTKINMNDTITLGYESRDWVNTRVEGFDLDSINIRLGTYCSIILNQNKIAVLNANSGIDGKWGSKLRVENSNLIQNAYLNIGNGNELNLVSPQINNLKSNISPEATVSLTGKGHSLSKLLQMLK